MNKLIIKKAQQRAKLYLERKEKKELSDQEFKRLFLLGKSLTEQLDEAALEGDFISEDYEKDQRRAMTIYNNYKIYLEFADEFKTDEDWNHFE